MAKSQLEGEHPEKLFLEYQLEFLDKLRQDRALYSNSAMSFKYAKLSDPCQKGVVSYNSSKLHASRKILTIFIYSAFRIVYKAGDLGFLVELIQYLFILIFERA